MIPPTCATGNAIDPTSPSSSPTRPCSVQPYAAASSVASVCRAPLGSPLDPEMKYTHSAQEAAPAGECAGSDPSSDTGAVTEAGGSDSPIRRTFGAVGRPAAMAA